MSSTTTEAARRAGEEPPATRGALAQRLLALPPVLGLPEKLYTKRRQGRIRLERGTFVLEPDAALTTNTYFGRVPASYWQRWTAVQEMTFEADYTGAGTIEVFASDAEGESRPVAARAVDGTGTVSLRVAVDKFVDGGAFWVDLRTTEAELSVSNARWTVAEPPRQRNTVVVVCTFNRPDDCVKTLQTMAADLTALDVLDAVYVIDQGSDQVSAHPDFPEVSAALAGRLRYVQQPNLGGAGGFTRGMYEVLEVAEDEHANILFMDDDIILEPESILRLSAFANSARNPVIVGAQMLYALHPKRLHTGAEYADLSQLTAGKVVDGALWDADMTKQNQDVRVDAAYNAWWSCMLPAEVVKATGYPLPVFFQWDDIEYGYRAQEHGFPTVTLPGAGVWHADFTWKDWDDWSRYFSIRNSLITSALHSEFTPLATAKVLLGHLVAYSTAMQYGLAATVIKAIEDFLEGPEVLVDGGQRIAAEIRQLRKDHPETIKHDASDAPEVGPLGERTKRAAPPPSQLKAVLAKRLAYQLAGRNKGSVAVPLDSSAWWHVAQYDRVVVTDASEEGVRIRQFDRALHLRTMRRAAAVSLRLAREGAAAAAAYREALPSLTSRENWGRLFSSREA